MKIPTPARLAMIALAIGANASAAPPPNGSFIFQNFEVQSNSYRVDDPSVIGLDPRSVGNVDGPKGLATGDLDGDGRNDLVASNTDGTVAVLFGGLGGGFEQAIYLPAGSANGLRDVHCTNVQGDNRPEIIAAHPFDGKLYIYSVTGPTGSPGSRVFAAAQPVDTWPGARSIISGDFNGDLKADLLVAGSGGINGSVMEFRGDGAGGFSPLVPISAINADEFDHMSATPVFSMQKWRLSGDSSDRVAVTYVGAGKVWFLKAPSPGLQLSIYSVLPLMAQETKVYDITMAYISPQSIASGEPDLLTADLGGSIYLRRSSAGQYPTIASGVIAVPGGPRSMGSADVNNDGSNDLVVTTRNGSGIYIFRNNGGVLTPASESATGASPRDLVLGDFDGNGQPDAAVINRDSQNITVHRIDPFSGTFRVSSLVKTNPGGAAAVSIRDMDGDNRGELLFLNPSTGEVNIQRFVAPGLYGLATRYSMGNRPQSLSTPDINGDGRRDLLCASLGDDQTGGGGLKYRLQLIDHTFGALVEVPSPAAGSAPMLRTVEGDFNLDGRTDCAAIYSDGRIGLYQGTTAGLVERRVESFVYKARAISAVDVDGDGDLDLVGVGVLGDLAYAINNRTWFTGGAFDKTVLPVSSTALESSQIIVDDKNGDGRMDVTVYAENAVSRWNGQAGSLMFQFVGTTPRPKTLSVARSEVAGPRRDIDGDGIADDFVLSPNQTTLQFYKGVTGNTNGANGEWWKLIPETYSVPSSTQIACGDIDGDGRVDVAGVGEYVWVALSGTLSSTLPQTPITTPVPEISGVLINEVLASTDAYVATGAKKPVDCVEIYNSTANAVTMTGWKLRRSATAGDAPSDFIFPASSLLPGTRRVIYCDGPKQSLGTWEAPYKLPEEGCSLTLLTAAEVVVNSVTFGPQQPDVSYSRLVDASRTFVYNPLPSIGATNYANGNVDPVISFKTVDMKLLKSNQWRFRGEAWSPFGMLSMNIYWRELWASPNALSGIIPLYDDGLHDDGAASDGAYAGDWDTPLPQGSAIEFYISGTDLNDKNVTKPGEAGFNATGPPTHYTLSLPVVASGFEISEVVSQNQGVVFDELGFTPDLVELRYTGPGTASSQGFFLSDSLFGFKVEELYALSAQFGTASSGSSHLVFLDDLAGGLGDLRHAPFKVDGDGDTIYLFRILPSGVVELVDWVKVPALGPNVAYARTGAGGELVQTTATPDAPNAPPGGKVHIVPGAAGGVDCLFVFSGAGEVEASFDLVTWTVVLPMVPDTGIEHVYREQAISPKRFFRVRR